MNVRDVAEFRSVRDHAVCTNPVVVLASRKGKQLPRPWQVRQPLHLAFHSPGQNLWTPMTISVTGVPRKLRVTPGRNRKNANHGQLFIKGGKANDQLRI